MLGTPPVEPALPAPSLAGVAILLEIGAEYNVINLLRAQKEITTTQAAEESGLSEEVIARYFEALAHAGLLQRTAPPAATTSYVVTRSLSRAIHDVGYLSWGLRACEPLIANARNFAVEPGQAQENHQRDGHLIARTSQWMGERSFYPHAEQAILTLRPKKFVDLGCGSARLLIKILQQIPDATGVGIDMSGKACDDARTAAEAAGVEGRLQIVQSPIQALAQNTSVLENADVIHAGFVLHDLMPDEEPALDRLLAACRHAAPKGTLLVVDAVPYAQTEQERIFSAAFSYLHHAFMGRQLQTEIGWSERLARAGFSSVKIEKLGIPGGRLFAAQGKQET